ncbi:hypothetical protein SALBM311S_03564 [Streptomyces alboniger]
MLTTCRLPSVVCRLSSAACCHARVLSSTTPFQRPTRQPDHHGQDSDRDERGQETQPHRRGDHHGRPPGPCGRGAVPVGAGVHGESGDRRGGRQPRDVGPLQQPGQGTRTRCRGEPSPGRPPGSPPSRTSAAPRARASPTEPPRASPTACAAITGPAPAAMQAANRSAASGSCRAASPASMSALARAPAAACRRRHRHSPAPTASPAPAPATPADQNPHGARHARHGKPTARELPHVEARSDGCGVVNDGQHRRQPPPYPPLAPRRARPPHQPAECEHRPQLPPACGQLPHS